VGRALALDGLPLVVNPWLAIPGWQHLAGNTWLAAPGWQDLVGSTWFGVHGLQHLVAQSLGRVAWALIMLPMVTSR
jgi:hypothetical protein